MFTSNLHRPLDTMLRDAIDGLDEPALLLDSELRISHVNEAAAPLVSDATFSTYSQDTDGCMAPALEGQPCAGEPLCGGCEVFRTLMAAVATGESAGPILIDRQLFLDGALVTRSYEAEAHPYRLDGKTGLLVTLNEIAADASGRLAG